MCFCVYLSVCVFLQEAELAARILLDQGQVTAWGSRRWEEGLSSPQEGKGRYLAFSPLCFLSFYSSPFLSPSLPFVPSPPFSEFPVALRSFIILFHPQNHLPVSFLPKLNSCRSCFYFLVPVSSLFPPPLNSLTFVEVPPLPLFLLA